MSPSDSQGEPEAPSRLRRLVRLAVVDTEPLRRHREFRLLFIGQGVSFFGGRVRQVAIPYQVYTLTHSPLAVGLLGLVEIFPILALALLGGALADARDRRRMIQLTEVAFALMSAALLLNALASRPHLWVLYTVTAAMAGLEALQRPSLDALMPRLVERHELTAAFAIRATQQTSFMIAGPALAGVLIAAIGLPATYGVDVASFAFSLGVLRMMRAAPPPAGAERPSLRRIAEGFRYAVTHPELLGTYLVDIVAMFFGMPQALFPALASQYGGAKVLGLLYAAPAAGAFIASSTSGWSRHVHRHGMAVILAAGLWGAAIAGVGLWHALPVTLAFLAAAGAADMISGVFRSVIWNGTVPDRLRGRLAGIEMMSYTTGPALGDVESGLVASLFSVRVSILSGGLLCVAGVALCAALLPAFRRYDSRAPVDPPAVPVAGE